jgi:adenosine deaminase CECR1
MAGNASTTLHDLRQLIEWSIEHSCMEEQRKIRVYEEWEIMWEWFCRRIVSDYGFLSDLTPKEALPTKAGDMVPR